MTQLAAQKNYSSQLTIVSENDNYTFRKKDRYYTNGLMIRFSKIVQTKTSNEKVWVTELGQKIYNPYRQDENYLQTLDRPFTGFLYIKSGITRITAKQNIVHWNVMAGLIGNAALGKEVQRWHHQNFNLRYPHGWETQLQSELGINTEIIYYQHLLPVTKAKRNFDAHALLDVRAGTLFTAASSGLLIKLGVLEKANNNVQWDAPQQPFRGSPSANPYTLFFYFEPAINYQLYNATVQGGLFNHKKDLYATSIKPFYFSHQLGLAYAKGRWTTGLAYIYKTKEAVTMMANENYASIQLGYRW